MITLKSKLMGILIDEIDGSIENTGNDAHLTGLIEELREKTDPTVDDAIALLLDWADGEIEEGTQLARVYDKFIALKVRS